MGRFVTTLKRSIGRAVDEVEPQGAPASRWGVGAAYAMSQFPIATPSSISADVPAASALMSQAGIGGPAPDGGVGAEPPLYQGIEHEILPFGSLVEVPAIKPTLPEVEDGRLFSFDRVKPLRNLSGTPIRLRAALPVNGTVTVPQGVAVEAKAETIMCIRRKMRRGVILALGQGGGYHKPPRRSPKSDIWC